MEKSTYALIDSPPVVPYTLEGPKVVFSDETKSTHRGLRTPLWQYLKHSRLLVILSAPLIYLCIIPFLLLDLLLSIYQTVCFPIYGIPKVRRTDHLLFDRGKLLYLNALERLNCVYCSYANGLIAYVAEIVGRTEQHWCPIKHAYEIPSHHSRYSHFLPYADAAAYRKELEEVRRGFGDLGR